jgi:hypothetical protein
MATQAGIWIDHKRAIVVLLTDAGPEIKTFESGIRPPGRAAATRPKARHTPNDFIAEDSRDRRDTADRKKFHDKVLAGLRGAGSLLVLGPGEAKGEFLKNFQSKKLRGVTAEVETADKLTDRQLAARVSEHFSKVPAAPAGKSKAPKQTAKPQAAKAPSKKRPAKSAR